MLYWHLHFEFVYVTRLEFQRRRPLYDALVHPTRDAQTHACRGYAFGRCKSYRACVCACVRVYVRETVDAATRCLIASLCLCVSPFGRLSLSLFAGVRICSARYLNHPPPHARAVIFCLSLSPRVTPPPIIGG